MNREVFARMSLDVDDSAQLVVQVAVAHHPGAQVTEELVVTLDGEPQSVTEVAGPHRNRLHLLECEQGRLEIGYRAQIIGAADDLVPDELDRATYLRPSRYAESDRLTAVAAAEFAGVTDPADLLAGVSSWVGERLSYVPGSSGPTDGAVDTLLSRAGVCRDYAHLVVALLRASDVPARLVAVYAPGLSPMDFHAVAEALVEGRWQVVDATLLAPRSTLVRIATGRDAADTAFLSTYGANVWLQEQEVGAVVGGNLPTDDVQAMVSLS